MQQVHAAGTCSRDMQQEHAAGSCSMDMQQGHSAGTCSRDIQQGHAAGTCSRGMQQGHAAGTCSKDMQQGHASWAGIHLSQDTCFSPCPAKLGSGVSNVLRHREEKRQFGLFSYALDLCPEKVGICPEKWKPVLNR
jgi:hypothetical protein